MEGLWSRRSGMQVGGFHENDILIFVYYKMVLIMNGRTLKMVFLQGERIVTPLFKP